jgi:2-octaprenyl-6-methoxyphenol hydroxylase
MSVKPEISSIRLQFSIVGGRSHEARSSAVGTMKSPHACTVVGTGPAGLTAALALATQGESVVCVGPRPDDAAVSRDTRTTALFPGSVNLLRNIGIWTHVADRVAPLAAIRIVDATGRLLRAPETLFRADDIGLADFGANVANADLMRALLKHAQANTRIGLVDAQVTATAPAQDAVELALSSGDTLSTRVLVAADGRGSLCRRAAGIAASAWSYPQSALATTFAHRRPHDGVSTEFHRSAGPLTTVPLPGLRSSLVWVDTPDAVARLLALDDDAFARELEDNLQGLLGPVGPVGPRASFPLSGLRADRMAARRTILVGEAGHVLPPIGAQGLNLGLRDIAAMVDCIAEARLSGEDAGADYVMDRYDSLRRADVMARSLGVDLLNRSLLASFLPLDLVRGAGLHLLNMWPQLRHSVVREGLQPAAFTSRLMRAPDA